MDKCPKEVDGGDSLFQLPLGAYVKAELPPPPPPQRSDACGVEVEDE